MFIRQTDVSREYPFSLATIHRWRRAGILTTFRQGQKRVLLLREELNTLVSKKEKVAVGGSDRQGENQFKPDFRCKDTQSSSDIQNISLKNDEDDKNSFSEA